MRAGCDFVESRLEYLVTIRIQWRRATQGAIRVMAGGRKDTVL